MAINGNVAILRGRGYIWERGYIEGTWLYFGNVAILWGRGYIMGTWLY